VIVWDAGADWDENIGTLDVVIKHAVNSELFGIGAGVVDTRGATLPDEDFDEDGQDNSVDLDDDNDGWNDDYELTTLMTDPFNPLDPVVVDDNATFDSELHGGWPGDPEISDPDADGSKEHPFDAIQKAIDVASHGMTVLVLDGAYQGVGNRDIRPNGKEIVIKSLNGMDNTTIDENYFSGFICDAGETTNTVIQGFEINSWFPFVGEPGIFCDGSSPLIKECRMYLCGDAGIRLKNSSAVIMDSEFIENEVGVVVEDGGSPTFDSCRIRLNRNRGLDLRGGFTLVQNCVIADNIATNFQADTLGVKYETGAGAFVSPTATASFNHCTIAGNLAEKWGGGMDLQGATKVRNTIVFNNLCNTEARYAGINFGSPKDIQYCCLQDSYDDYPGVGNIITDPNLNTNNTEYIKYYGGSGLFPSYALQAGSSAIDAGTLTYGLSEDIDGEARPSDGNGSPSIMDFDMGAYEYVGSTLDSDSDGLSDADETIRGTGVNDPDSDDDGLLDGAEVNPHGSNPLSADSDGDGFGDAWEVARGSSPTTDDSDVVAYITANTETFGLYPSNVVLDVALGESLIEISGGNAVLDLQLETSEDLLVWTNAGDAVEWTLPVDADKQFLRVRSSTP